MEISTKKAVQGLILVIVLIVVGYAIYKLYNIAVEDATARIKQGVTEGVSQGVGQGLNPLNLLGGNR